MSADFQLPEVDRVDLHRIWGRESLPELGEQRPSESVRERVPAAGFRQEEIEIHDPKRTEARTGRRRGGGFAVHRSPDAGCGRAACSLLLAGKQRLPKRSLSLLLAGKQSSPNTLSGRPELASNGSEASLG
nr:hypothetical protein Iba_chr04eCG6710 [Ipomoea batatas]